MKSGSDNERDDEMLELIVDLRVLTVYKLLSQFFFFKMFPTNAAKILFISFRYSRHGIIKY